MPFNIPVNVVAPLPPLATGKVCNHVGVGPADKIYPVVPAAKKLVAPDPVLYGIWFAPPPAILVADAAMVALPAVKLAAVPVNPAPLP